MSPAPEAKGLSEEEANTIGWHFVSKYYESYNDEIDKLFSMYDSQSLLSHARFPRGESTTPLVVKAKGRQAIKSRYAEDDCADRANRIVITLAAIDVCLGTNILVVVYGEWAKPDTPFYQFTQTIILKPRNNAYFIVNDVLRFFTWDLKDASSSPETQLSDKQSDDIVGDNATTDVNASETVADDAKPQPTEDAAPVANGEVKQPSAEVPAGAAAAEPAVEEAAKPLVTADQAEPVANDDLTKEPVEELATEPVAEPVVEEAKEPEMKESKPKTDDAKPSVASLATASPSPSPLTPAPSSWAGIVSSLTPKLTTKASPVPKKPVAAQPKATTTSPQSPNNGFQPVHHDKPQWNLVILKVQGTLRFDPEAIKASVEQNYGAIKFWKHNNYGWTCDFASPELKTRALGDKQFEVNGVTVVVEPKVVKKPINKDGKFVDKRKNFTKNGATKFNKDGFDKRKVH